MAALENIIIIGDPANPLFTFHNMAEGNDTDGIASGYPKGVFAVDVSGDELSIDTVTVIVQCGAPQLPPILEREIYVSPNNEIYISPGNEIYYHLTSNAEPVTPQGDLTAIPYGMPLRWYCDGQLMASFYCRQPLRVGRYTYQITAISGVGLLDVIDHVGGVYDGTQTFSDVVTDIVGGAFPFTIAPALASQEIYNWLPYDTARNNLHRLLIALGASMRRDANGEATFVFLSDLSPASVPDDRIAIGGSVNYDAPATRCEVTEHAYYPYTSVDLETLFDNTNGGAIADHTLVKFGGDAPVIVSSLVATGTLTIDESGVNYAVVTGVGTLTGKRYTHVTRIVSASDTSATGAENVKHLRDDFTLVSIANSLNVARRLLAYYSGARKVSARIALEGERCGDVLSLNDPFFDPITAFLQSASVSASSNLLASCELVENYVPAHQGNNVTFSETLTGSGTWISPFTGTLTVLVCSGAQGGGAGEAGETAPTASISSYSESSAAGVSINYKTLLPRNAKAGKGGQPGTPGNGGKVYVAQIQVTEGQQISFSCGVGGAGEVFGSETGGSNGTATIFGSISSDSGAIYPAGYPDPITGDLIGAPGDAGIAGGDGVGYLLDENNVPYLNMPQPIVVDGVSYTPGAQGNNNSGTYSNYDDGYSLGYSAIGGFGGGAAYKANGGNGKQGYSGTSNRIQSLVLGYGGDGATALAPPAETRFGRGGTSGNGGGGGGAPGSSPKENSIEALRTNTWMEFARWKTSAPSYTQQVNNVPASGGNGSDGGVGGPGVIRLYGGE